MLKHFAAIRSQLIAGTFSREERTISGTIIVTPANVVQLQQLQDAGLVAKAESANKSVDFTLLKPLIPSLEVRLVLNPVQLDYYEDVDDLISRTASEPITYYVHELGELRREDVQPPQTILNYREMLRAKQLLQRTADLGSEESAIFLAPEKLEVPFRCSSSDLRTLPELFNLEAQLAPGTVEREQRVILFKRSLREHLRPHPVEHHFGLFLQNLASIYDTYNRDYELWLGNTFGELEKSFEEKRLKFVSDLNGILAGIQGTILAVPLAALLIGDKFDATKPIKNIFLAVAALFVGSVALKLLRNQEHTLDATVDAIEAVKNDFEKKQTKRKEEFKSRLGAIDRQEKRVRGLLGFFRVAIIVIMAAVTVVFLFFLSPPVARFITDSHPRTNASPAAATNALRILAPR